MYIFTNKVTAWKIRGKFFIVFYDFAVWFIVLIEFGWEILENRFHFVSQVVNQISRPKSICFTPNCLVRQKSSMKAEKGSRVIFNCVYKMFIYKFYRLTSFELFFIICKYFFLSMEFSSFISWQFFACVLHRIFLFYEILCLENNKKNKYIFVY